MQTRSEQQARFSFKAQLSFPLACFQIEFAASYLPSFFKNYISTGFDLESEHFSRLTEYLAHMGLGDYFPRFGREFPDVLASSIEVQLSRLATLIQTGLNKVSQLSYIYARASCF